MDSYSKNLSKEGTYIFIISVMKYIYTYIMSILTERIGRSKSISIGL